MEESPCFLTISDEDGNEFELERLDDIEFEDKAYTVFVPADIDEMDTEDPDYGYIILRTRTEDGEEVFDSVDDEDELDRVYEYYLTTLDEEYEEE